MARVLSILFLLSVLITVFLGFSDSDVETPPPIPQPVTLIPEDNDYSNVVVIIADDLGYTDLGSFGGEIDTPNLDALASAGTRLSQFHVGAACSPTRAMLMTGVDNHLVGLGAFNQQMIAENQEGKPGYEGYLNKSAASIGEIFLNAGFHTYISGKWHLGKSSESSPPAYGFQRSFVQLEGGAGHFNALPVTPFKRQATYRDNGVLTELPVPFYSSDFYVDNLINYIEQDKNSGRPFLGFLAFTAPHWPLQAKPETIKKYQDRYLQGYDQLALERRESLVELGILNKLITPEPYRHDDIPAWDDLSEEDQRYEAKRMAIYAAMIDDMDQSVGRFIDYLKAENKYDDTLFVFLSDNGAEGHDMGDLSHLVAFSTLFGLECCDNSYQNMGSASSFMSLGPAWASASVGPHRIYKGFPTQGGVIAPAFVTGNDVLANKISHDLLTVKDILPTLLDYSGIAEHGQLFSGRKVFPIEGKSMKSMLAGEPESVHGKHFLMGWEFFGKHGVRVGDWKLIRMPEPYGNNEWLLYNLRLDPAERHDVSKDEPEQLKTMLAYWTEYSEQANIILPSSTPMTY